VTLPAQPLLLFCSAATLPLTIILALLFHAFALSKQLIPLPRSWFNLQSPLGQVEYQWHSCLSFSPTFQNQQTFEIPCRQGFLRFNYIRACGAFGAFRCTPLCARVHNYTAFVCRSLIFLCIVLRNREWKYMIFLLLFHNTKTLNYYGAHQA